MLSRELELTLNFAFKDARRKKHELISVEHLLSALLENASATEVLKACGANLDELRDALEEFVDSSTPLLPSNEERETTPTVGFQRVLQRAVFHVQSSGKKEVEGANVLVAIYSEQESHAVFLLKQQNINRIDVVNYISHGAQRQTSGDSADHTDNVKEGKAAETKESALALYATNLNESAKKGVIDPLVGRDDEVERVIQTLSRRRKNNPLLVGESGVGKTAIAEG